MNKNIPKNTVKRLSIYLRCINKLLDDGVTSISSNDLGQLLKINPSQIRKDLSYFGEFGVQGLGYKIEKLRDTIRSIIGMNETQNIILVGVGNLGKAILNYNILLKRGFSIVAAFDKDPNMIGKIINNVGVFDIKKINTVIPEKNVKCAILTLPPEEVKEVAGFLISNGIKGFLNFTPVILNLPKEIVVVNVDISSSLEQLMYYLQNNTE